MAEFLSIDLCAIQYLILLKPLGECLAVPRAGNVVVGGRAPMSEQLELRVIFVKLVERLALEKEALQTLLLVECLELKRKLHALSSNVLAV